MMSLLFILFTVASVIFFPWVFTGILILIVAFIEPLAAVAIGIFADTIYYSPSTFLLPLFTIAGATLTLLSLFVRSRLRTSSMR